MDLHTAKPILDEIQKSHAIPSSLDALPSRPSVPPTAEKMPQLKSGEKTFSTVEEVIRTVRELHGIEDPVVAPHRSKYAARVIMTDILAILRPMISRSDEFSEGEVNWLTEQVGRLGYLNGVNHIEAEETSAGEKMLVKSMLQFKNNAIKYPFDVIDGYNHLGIVWSNRTQHDVAHVFLQQAQHAFLMFKKCRKEALSLLTPEERKQVEALDEKEQQEVDPEPSADAAAEKAAQEAIDDATKALEKSKLEESKSNEQKDEQKTADAPTTAAAPAAASSSSSTTNAVIPAPSYSLSSSHPGYRFLDSKYWHTLEVTHTLTLFFLAQVFGHMKKRDLAAIYCHLCLNRQLKQRRDFQKHDWVTNAIGLSFYYSGRKNFQQAHHCLLAAQHFIKKDDIPKRMNTPQDETNREQMLAADLCRAWGAFYLKWLQRSRDAYIENERLLPTDAQQDQQALEAAQAAALSSGNPLPTVAEKESQKAADEDENDPSTNLASLPENELLELKQLQKLDRERERHFESQIEDEADEEEDDLFGDLSKARKMKSKDDAATTSDAVIDRTLPASLTAEEQYELKEELKKSTDDEPTAAATAVTPASASSSTLAAAAAATPAPGSAASAGPLFIEFKSLNLHPSPRCVPATSYLAARLLFRSSLEWFTKAGWFYILDGYVSDHIPIQQDISLLYKLLAVFDMDLSRQCKMHKRRIDMLTPIYKQLSVASYQEFFQQLTDELATTYSDMMELKIFILSMKVKFLGKKFTEKKRDDAQMKINELALRAVQFYQTWLSSWSKDGKEVDTLDEYYHRWYLMAMFKIARCYSKIYSSDPQVLNQFIKKSWEAYKAVVAKAQAWKAEHVMPVELELCKEMIQLLPHKMDRVSGNALPADMYLANLNSKR